MASSTNAPTMTSRLAPSERSESRGRELVMTGAILTAFGAQRVSASTRVGLRLLHSTPFTRALSPARWRRDWEDGDAVPSHRSHPQVLADLNSDGACRQHVAVRLAKQLLDIQGRRIDPRHV